LGRKKKNSSTLLKSRKPEREPKGKERRRGASATMHQGGRGERARQGVISERQIWRTGYWKSGKKEEKRRGERRKPRVVRSGRPSNEGGKKTLYILYSLNKKRRRDPIPEGHGDREGGKEKRKKPACFLGGQTS